MVDLSALQPASVLFSPRAQPATASAATSSCPTGWPRGRSRYLMPAFGLTGGGALAMGATGALLRAERFGGRALS